MHIYMVFDLCSWACHASPSTTNLIDETWCGFLPNPSLAAFQAENLQPDEGLKSEFWNSSDVSRGPSHTRCPWHSQMCARNNSEGPRIRNRLIAPSPEAQTGKTSWKPEWVFNSSTQQLFRSAPGSSTRGVEIGLWTPPRLAPTHPPQ